MRAPGGGVAQLKAVQHFIYPAVPFQPWPSFRREFQILAQGHIREQRVVLKNVAAVARLRRKVYATGGVEQDLVVQHDAAFVGTHKTGDGIEDLSFPGPAWSEQ